TRHAIRNLALRDGDHWARFLVHCQISNIPDDADDFSRRSGEIRAQIFVDSDSVTDRIPIWPEGPGHRVAYHCDTGSAGSVALRKETPSNNRNVENRRVIRRHRPHHGAAVDRIVAERAALDVEGRAEDHLNGQRPACSRCGDPGDLFEALDTIVDEP